MKPSPVCCVALGIALLVSMHTRAVAEEQKPPAEENFYAKSLHYTNRGIEFIYSKEHGGLERLTGLTASQAGCLKGKCHARTCDTCHLKEVNGKATYSRDPAVAQAACEKCHGVPSGADVHREKGMKCMSCHSTREVHGDGVAYDTYMQPGVLDTRCEKCHSNLKRSISHTIHKGRLDCSTCHVAELVTCLNCHVETRVKEGKDVQIELKGMFFLVNHEGKVTLGNFLTCVYKGRAMITLAPDVLALDHEGRPEVPGMSRHANRPGHQGRERSFPARWESGQVTNVQGVIPVLEGMKWNVPYLNYEEGKWVPLQNPAEPLLNYSGFCTPLTREQFAKLEKARGAS